MDPHVEGTSKPTCFCPSVGQCCLKEGFQLHHMVPQALDNIYQMPMYWKEAICSIPLDEKSLGKSF